MMGSRGGLGACGSLVLLSLCSWTAARAAAPRPGGDLSAEARSPSSIALQWPAPHGLDRRHTPPWGLGAGPDGRTEARRTAGARFTVDRLGSRSLHEISKGVQQDEANGSQGTLQASTDPNPVRNLKVGAQTTTSITLIWEKPDDPDFQDYTYWIQWTGDGNKTETRNTTDTSFTVDGLRPGSLYEFAVWAEKNGTNSSVTTCEAATDPNPVRNLKVGAQTTTSITLIWEKPDDPDFQDYTYWIQWTGDGNKTETRNTTDTSFTVDGLRPGSLYEFAVWAEKNGANSSVMTCEATTDPNPVRNLKVGAQTTTSITLIWEKPDDPDFQDYTYWIQWTGDGNKTETRNTTDTSFTVDGLRPGSLYEFAVWAEKNGANSSVMTCEATTDPNPVRNLKVVAQTTTSITLIWEKPDDPDFQDYTYWIQWTGDGNKTETRNTTDTSFTVDGLRPGSLYEFAVWAEKNGANSSVMTCEATTDPNPVRNLKVGAQTTTSITLIWEKPDDPDFQDYTYWIQWTGDGNKTETRNTTDTSFTVDGLRPGSLYEFAVWAEKNGANSSVMTCEAATVPSAVTSLRVQQQTNSSITLSWTAPPGRDRAPYTYRVSWVKEGTSAVSRQDTPDTGITLKELEAGRLYTVTVWAERNNVSSDNRTLTGATAPNAVTDLHNETQTNNSITLRWEVPTDPQSQLYTYRVQWAPGRHPQGQQDPQGHQANHTGSTNGSCYEVQALEPGTLYAFSVWADKNNVTSDAQSLLASTAPSPVTITSCVSTSGGHGVILTWSCPVGGYEAFELQVGGQTDSQNGSSCGRGVSVWDLKPAQSYLATVTAIWDGVRAPSAPVTCYTENAGVIAGAVVGVLLFLILVGLLVFFLKRRHRKSQRRPAPRDLLDSSFLEDIPAQDFAAHVRKNEKDANLGFAKEYQQLALEGTNQSQTVASALENSTKNRYRNVLPYDWCRVTLKPCPEEPGSDYINASFMPGLCSPQEFIAAQGPLPQTVGDFWRLVWEQQSRALVMLTNCVESGQVKCEHYWPLDAQPCTYRHLQVTLEAEEVLENWTVRDLRVQHTQEQKTLPVRQFHYMTWPDHGVPHSPDPLLAFWKVVRQWLDQTVEGGPPIVHCSAGVGRTGTFIALDILLRQLEREHCVGVFSCVRKMRQSRPLMLQTEAQYVFLHQCILQGLQQSHLAPAENGAYENPLYENI